MIGFLNPGFSYRPDPVVTCHFCDRDSTVPDLHMVARDIDTAICYECVWRCVTAILYHEKGLYYGSPHV